MERSLSKRPNPHAAPASHRPWAASQRNASAASRPSLSSREAPTGIKEEPRTTGLGEMPPTPAFWRATRPSSFVTGFQEEVDQVLQHAQFPEDCCKYVVDQEPCNPGLELLGYGGVGVPISPRDAEALMDYYRRMRPAGMGEFRGVAMYKPIFHNPRWPDALNKAFGTLKDMAGIDVPCRIEEPILLLCSSEAEASHLLRTSINTRSAFAKFLVTLPCSQVGTKISFNYDGEVVDLPLGELGPFAALNSLSFLHGSCTLLPPVRGYFAAFIFDVVATNEHNATVKRYIPSLSSRVQQGLRNWVGSDAGPDVLAFPLSTPPSDGARIFNRLTRKNHAQLQFLQKACSPHPYGIYLATLERTIKHHLCLSEDYNVRHVDKLDGTPVSDLGNIEPSDLESFGIYNDDRNPDCTEVDNVTGTQRTRMTYTDSVVLVMKPGYESRFFLEDGLDCKSFDEKASIIREAVRQLRRDGPNSKNKRHIHRLLVSVTSDLAVDCMIDGLKHDEFVSAITDAMATQGLIDSEMVSHSLICALDPGYDHNRRKIIEMVEFLPWHSALSSLKSCFARVRDIDDQLRILPAFLDIATQPTLRKRILALVEEELYEPLKVKTIRTKLDRNLIANMLIRTRSLNLLNEVLDKGPRSFPLDSCQRLFHDLFCRSRRADDNDGRFLATTCVPRLGKKIIACLKEPECIVGAAMPGFVLVALRLGGIFAENALITLVASTALQYKNNIARRCICWLGMIAQRGIELALPQKTLNLLHTFITQTLIHFYVWKVGQHPQPTFRATRPGYRCDKGCSDCAGVNLFLRSTQYVFESGDLTDSQRSHVGEMISTFGNLKIERIELKPPHTLRLRITKLDQQYEDSCRRWKKDRMRYLNVMANISVLGTGVLEDITKDKYGMLMTENLGAMKGTRSERPLPQVCLEGFRLFIISSPADSSTTPLTRQGAELIELIESHGGVVVPEAGPLQEQDVGVYIGELPSLESWPRVDGAARRLLDRKGLLHLIQTCQSLDGLKKEVKFTSGIPSQGSLKRKAEQLAEPQQGGPSRASTGTERAPSQNLQATPESSKHPKPLQENDTADIQTAPPTNRRPWQTAPPTNRRPWLAAPSPRAQPATAAESAHETALDARQTRQPLSDRTNLNPPTRTAAATTAPEKPAAIVSSVHVVDRRENNRPTTTTPRVGDDEGMSRKKQKKKDDFDEICSFDDDDDDDEHNSVDKRCVLIEEVDLTVL